VSCPCPIQVRKLRVRTLSVEHNEISWELAETTSDVLDYTFQVLRSEGAEGPYEPVSEEFTDRYLFVDNAIMSLHRWRTLYYKVRVRCRQSDKFWDYGPASAEQEEDLVAREIRSHISLLMREFIGERCWVLPVRTFGQRCPDCWVDTLKKKKRSGCRTCWDTSFIRGYMHPIESWISLDPNPKQDQFTGLGKLQQTDTTARMTYYPPTKPGDLIIFGATNTRYKVTQTSLTRHVGTPVHQELQLHEVPQSTIEYHIPLELCDALENIFLKPARNFTNPQQLEALDDEVTNEVFMLYLNDNCGGRPCR
jgi:hypothetical protein